MGIVGGIGAALAFALWMRRWEAGLFFYLVTVIAWGIKADICYALGDFTNDITKALRQ